MRRVNPASVSLKATKNTGGMMHKFFAKLWDDESGQDLTEYVLLIVLISLAATAALTALGGAVSTGFQNAASEVTNQT